MSEAEGKKAERVSTAVPQHAWLLVRRPPPAILDGMNVGAWHTGSQAYIAHLTLPSHSPTPHLFLFVNNEEEL